MKASLVRWMRKVMPDSVFAWGWVAGEVFIELVYLTAVVNGWLVDEIFFRNIRLTWLSAGAGIYGAGRVMLFHPAFNEAYRNWLQTTPWTVERPLPGGPLNLTLQDVVVVAALTFLTRVSTEQALLVPLSFLVGYLAALAASARLCGDWVMAYLLAFGLGGVALLWRSLPASAVAAFACCPVSLVAVRRSLKRFPWSFDSRSYSWMFNSNPEDILNHRLGWPHDQLSPVLPKPWLPLHDSVCLSLLAGWVALIVHSHVDSRERLFVFLISLQAIFFIALARVAQYSQAHRAPIDLFGRIRGFRWIIPGYDVIFVAPFLAFLIQLVAQGLAFLLMEKNFLGPNAADVTAERIAAASSVAGTTISLLVLSLMGPGLAQWRLTGHHRIVFDVANRQRSAPFSEL